MFDVGKMLRRRSALWLVFPSALLLVTLFISRSADSRISPVPGPSLVTRSATPTEPNLSSDLDHDGLPADVSVKLGSGPLRERLFRTAPGTYSSSDVAAGKFSEFADAQTLKLFNATFVSRDRSQAQPGDLLFFYQPYVQKFPFHVVIFLGFYRFKLLSQQVSLEE